MPPGAVQGEILTVLGRVSRRLGVFDKAQVLLEQALAVGRTAYGGEHVRLAQTLNDLGVLLTDKGDYAAAARTLERALSMRRRLLGPEHADVAVTLVELGRVYQDQGLNQRADPLLRESLAVRRKGLGESHRETAVSLNAVASVLRLNGRPGRRRVAASAVIPRVADVLEPPPAHRPKKSVFSRI